MRIFEFQFNPKAQKDRFFRVFSFEPKNPPAAREEQGSLYIAGELQNVLPGNETFLQKLADLIYKEYTAAEASARKVWKYSECSEVFPEKMLF